MMQCIENAIAAGYITRARGEALQRDVTRRLREGLAPPEVRRELLADAAAAIQETERRALLTEAVRLARVEDVLSHRNARGEHDPGQALAFLHQHNGFASFTDIETQAKVVLGRAEAIIGQFLLEFKKGWVTGDLRRREAAVVARMENVVRALHGEKTRDARASEIAKAVSAAFESLRIEANAAGAHIPKLDDFGLPHRHDAQALLAVGQSAWVDYMMRSGVLNRQRMVSPLTGRRLGEDELRASLELIWARITTNGWIDREPSMIPVTKGVLANRHAEHRFLHFRNADAWLDYSRTFGQGDAFVSIMQHLQRMSKDVATLQVLGPNPEAMRTYLKQLVQKQAASVLPVATIIAEQTVRLREMVRKAAGNDDYDELVGRIARALGDIDELRRKQGTLGDGHVPTESGVWNRLEQLEAMRRELGEIEHGPTHVERDRILGRVASIDGQIETAFLKGETLSRRNRAKVDRLRAERTDLMRRFDEIQQFDTRLKFVAPAELDRINGQIGALKARVSDVDVTQAPEIVALEQAITTLATKLSALPRERADEIAAASQQVRRARTRLGQEPPVLDGNPLSIPAALFKGLLDDIRQWRASRDPELQARLEQQLGRAIGQYHDLVGKLDVDAGGIQRAMALLSASRAMVQGSAGFRAVANPMDAANRAIAHADALWDVVRGAHFAPVDSFWANTFQAARNVTTASLLGSAQLSALGDVIFQRRARRLAGLPYSTYAIMHQYIASIRNGTRDDAIEAQLLFDQAAHSLGEQARMLEGTGTDPYAAGRPAPGRLLANAQLANRWSGFVADRVIAVQGLSLFTQTGKHILGLEFQLQVAKLKDRDFSNLPVNMQATMRRQGIGVVEWDVLRQAPIHETESGRRLLRPSEVASGPGGRALADLYHAMILRTVSKGVLEGDAQTRSVLQFGRPGTVPGEFSRNASQFLSFGVSAVFKHLGEIQREFQAGRYGNGALEGAGLMVAAAIAGGIILQLKQLEKGRDPYGFDKLSEGVVPGWEFWGAAMLQAGGLGIFGDFLFAPTDRGGGQLASKVAGPTGAMAGRLHSRLYGGGKAAAKGEELNPGRAILDTVRDFTPKVWYTRLLTDRMFDAIQQRVDDNHEAVFRRSEQQEEKRSGGGYWWGRGELLPSRAPTMMQPALPEVIRPGTAVTPASRASGRQALGAVILEAIGISSAHAGELSSRSWSTAEVNRLLADVPVQKGQFFPATVYGDGSVRYDETTGILGALIRGFKFPGRVLSGELSDPDDMRQGAMEAAALAMTGGFSATVAGAVPRVAIGSSGARLAGAADDRLVALVRDKAPYVRPSDLADEIGVGQPELFALMRQAGVDERYYLGRRDALIAQRLLDGERDSAVAREFQVSRATLSAVRKGYDITTRPQAKTDAGASRQPDPAWQPIERRDVGISESDRIFILDAWRKFTPSEIARELGTTAKKINRVARDLDLDAPLPQALRERIAYSLEGGRPLLSVAREFDVAKETVRAIGTELIGPQPWRKPGRTPFDLTANASPLPGVALAGRLPPWLGDDEPPQGGQGGHEDRSWTVLDILQELIGIKPAHGLFIGPQAKTYDHARAREADRMRASGETREEIWARTGMWRQDDKWLMEIDDTSARLPELPESGIYDGPLAGGLDHGELYRAYPQARQWKLERYEDGSQDHVGTQWKDGRGRQRLRVLDEEVGTALHEVQHAIDDTEGVAYVAGKKGDRAFAVPYERRDGERRGAVVDARRNLTPAARAARPPWFDDERDAGIARPPR